MTAMKYVFSDPQADNSPGASAQESFYVTTFRHLANAVEAGLLNIASFEARDDLTGRVLKIKIEFEEIGIPLPTTEVPPGQDEDPDLDGIDTAE